MQSSISFSNNIKWAVSISCCAFILATAFVDRSGSAIKHQCETAEKPPPWGSVGMLVEKQKGVIIQRAHLQTRTRRRASVFTIIAQTNTHPNAAAHSRQESCAR